MRTNGERVPTTTIPNPRARSPTEFTFVERIHLSADQRRVRAPAQRRVSGDRPSTTTTATTAQLTSKQRLASRVYNLSLDVAALRQELEALTLHRSLLQTRASFSRRGTGEAAMETTSEYWDVFQRGFEADDARQSAFLDSVAGDKFQLGLSTARGVDGLLEQWQLYTAYFAISRYELHGVQLIALDDATGACITRSDGVFCGTITKHTLERVFPVVLHDAQLTQHLLSKQITTPIAFTLHFDSQGKWSRHDTETDFLQQLAQALDGDVLRAAAVLVEANVSNGSLLKSPQELISTARQACDAARAKRPWYLAHIPVLADEYREGK